MEFTICTCNMYMYMYMYMKESCTGTSALCMYRQYRHISYGGMDEVSRHFMLVMSCNKL